MTTIKINPQHTTSESNTIYGDNYNITTNINVVLSMNCKHNGKTNFAMTIMKGHIEWRREFGGDVYASGEDEAFLTALPTVIAAHKIDNHVYKVNDGDQIEMGGSTWLVSDNKRFHYPTLTKVS